MSEILHELKKEEEKRKRIIERGGLIYPIILTSVGYIPLTYRIDSTSACYYHRDIVGDC